MDFNYSIEIEDSLVRVQTHGVFDFLKVYEMWRDIATSCDASDCHSVLGVSNLSEPMPSADAFDHVNMLEAVGMTSKHQIAWVAARPALMDALRSIEIIVRDRSTLNMRAFESTSDAEQWLSA